MLHFNDIVREEAERYGVLVMDFQQYPIIQVEWARRYFAPWLGRGIRRIPLSSGLTAKRPVLTPVPTQWS
jgi:hypothetical protein